MLRLNPEGLLLEGARRVDEWSVIAKKITSLDAVYALDGESRVDRPDADAQLVEIEQRVLPLVNGALTVRAIVDATGLTDFEVCRVLFACCRPGGCGGSPRPLPPAPRQDVARLEEHRNLGIAFYRTGMLTEAEREFRRVAELRPSDAAAPFQLGLIALRQARWLEASNSSASAAESQPVRVPPCCTIWRSRSKPSVASTKPKRR